MVNKRINSAVTSPTGLENLLEGRASFNNSSTTCFTQGKKTSGELVTLTGS